MKKLIYVLFALLLVVLLSSCADNDVPGGKPIARVTYYQMPDGSIQTVIENIGDEPLTITQDGFLLPEGVGDHA